MKKHEHAFDLLWTNFSRRKKCWKSCSMCNKCKTKKRDWVTFKVTQYSFLNYN